jgi:hypothetical protein
MAATGLDTAVYYWLLLGEDTRGNLLVDKGSFVNILDHEICFIGHSIVVGMGGSRDKGGFRSGVIDSLRDATSALRRVRCVGPLTTTFWEGSPDDSCLAVNGAQARHIYDSLYMHPDLNADEWVLSVGVNGDYYNFWERYYTVALIEAIYRRNNAASIYVLNGLPLPDTMGVERISRLNTFNATIEGSVSDWQNAGRSIYLVDAFHALAPDSSFPDQYFTDHLHPNDSGYAVIASEILDVMGNH